MEEFKSKLLKTIDYISEKNIEKRKTLISQRTDKIKQLENEYLKRISKRDERRTLFIPRIEKFKKLKKIIIQSNKDLKKNLEESKKTLKSKKEIKPQILIEKSNYQPIENNKENDIKEINMNDLFIKKNINRFDHRNTTVLSSKSLGFNISRRSSSRNSQKIDLDNKLSSKLFNSFVKEDKIQDQNLFSNLLQKNSSFQNIKKNYTERKKNNPLEIQDEDRIFDELNQNNLKQFFVIPKHKKHIHSSTMSTKEKVKNLKKKSTINAKTKSLSPEKKILNDVYKFSPDFFEKINQIKKKRKKYNLLNYQNSLLNTISDNFSKENFKKLEKKFLGLRNYSFHKIILNREFIEKIEKKEKGIIKRINSENNKCVNMMKMINDGINYKSFYLPKVKFYQVIKKKNPHFFQTELSIDSNNI